EESIALWRSIGDELLLGEGLYRVGLTALFQDDLPALQRFTHELAELGERLEEPRLRALAGSNRATGESERGNVARAVALADEALELMRQVGDAYHYGFFQNVLGEMTRLAGDQPGARPPTRRSCASPSSSDASAFSRSVTPTWARWPRPRGIGPPHCSA